MGHWGMGHQEGCGHPWERVTRDGVIGVWGHHEGWDSLGQGHQGMG